MILIRRLKLLITTVLNARVRKDVTSYLKAQKLVFFIFGHITDETNYSGIVSYWHLHKGYHG